MAALHGGNSNVYDTQRTAAADSPATSHLTKVLKSCHSSAKTVLHHLRKHTGVGIICAVAYFDPGNWGVDLQAGSQYGYRLLFVVLLAGLFAVFLQCLASKLGCVTGLDLASHCRLLLHDRPKHKMFYRWGLLYPLYAMSEIAIIATDLAEMLGSAIALCMLFPKLQIWQGVLITTFDVILILFLGDPLKGRPVRSFEMLIAALVFAVLICMAIVISKVHVDWSDAFEGFVPSRYIFPNGALYTSVGILGATVMPHSLFLGSSLATADRVTPASEGSSSALLESIPRTRSDLYQITRLGIRRMRNGFIYAFQTKRSEDIDRHTKHAERENNSLQHVKAHIYHGMVDVITSLLGFAVLINSLILILASAVFFYGTSNPVRTSSLASRASEGPASLFDAYALISELVGQSSATVFALALLAAGQSSSIVATVAGQAVSEGFLKWNVSPALRRLFTRLIAVIPSMVVAVVMGRSGIDTLLVASQVVLSVCLPFITFPLLLLTSSKTVMRVRKPATSAIIALVPPAASMLHPNSSVPEPDIVVEESRLPHDGWVDFSNSKLTIALGVAIWLVAFTANMFVLINLGVGI